MVKIIEGVVVSHLRTHGEIPLMREAITFLWYYYDKRGREIDAILEKPQKPVKPKKRSEEAITIALTLSGKPERLALRLTSSFNAHLQRFQRRKKEPFFVKLGAQRKRALNSV